MKRLFNIAGPCLPGKHYSLPTLVRCPEMGRLIATEQYFVVHAARQSGKTTLLKALAAEVNREGERVAVYCSLESVQGLTDPRDGIPAIVRSLVETLRWHPATKELALPSSDLTAFNTVMKAYLADLCTALGKPLIMLFDEADCLSKQTLITFLRQLRDGFVSRDQAPFPTSIVLVGMRNIRDYKAKIRPDGQTLGSASPFNIITEALTLTDFTRPEVASLYAQHTADTGQVFEETAVDRAHYWTQGQPWLVNAIARECVEKLLARDFARPVTAALVDQAAHNIILRRDTHIDSLLERLKEPRVRRVIEPVILGEGGDLRRLSDDYQYALDLGLIRDERGKTVPANPLYAEVIGRVLSYDAQQNMLAGEIGRDAPFYLDGNGRFDMRTMLSEFQQFWRENSEIWCDRFDYREAAPHLILMGFLQRVLNGGSRVVREMAAGTGRLDLCVEYGDERYPIEVKVRSSQNTVPDGLVQLGRYLDTLGVREGWLVVFDRDPDRPWDDKITWEDHRDDAGRTLHLVGC